MSDLKVAQYSLLKCSDETYDIKEIEKNITAAGRPAMEFLEDVQKVVFLGKFEDLFLLQKFSLKSKID